MLWKENLIIFIFLSWFVRFPFLLLLTIAHFRFHESPSSKSINLERISWNCCLESNEISPLQQCSLFIPKISKTCVQFKDIINGKCHLSSHLHLIQFISAMLFIIKYISYIHHQSSGKRLFHQMSSNILIILKLAPRNISTKNISHVIPYTTTY